MSDPYRPPYRWRVGRRVGRTLYLQEGAEPTEHDRLIGLMDTPELAKLAADAVNAYRSLGT